MNLIYCRDTFLFSYVATYCTPGYTLLTYTGVDSENATTKEHGL
jgi:hypothetical protein